MQRDHRRRLRKSEREPGQGKEHISCPEFRPDHNGECLNCDDWADAHDGTIAAPDLYGGPRLLESFVEVVELMDPKVINRAQRARQRSECADGGRMNVWFGVSWARRSASTTLHVPTPVGETCLWCDEDSATTPAGASANAVRGCTSIASCARCLRRRPSTEALSLFRRDL